MKILLVPGSLRQNSFNKSLARHIQKSQSLKAEFEIFEINEVPMFNEDIEENLPEVVINLIESIKSSDGMIIITPEYNNSLPAPIRNVIHWLSRKYSKPYILNKPLGIAGVSDGGFGTVRAQHELLQLAVVVGFKVDAQHRLPISKAYDVFNEDGEIVDEDIKTKIDSFIDNYLEWISK
jgi:NAD(P)H-dependent FMN reductase